MRALGLGLVLYTVKVGRSPYVCLYGWMYNKGGAGEGEGEKGKGEDGWDGRYDRSILPAYLLC